MYLITLQLMCFPQSIAATFEQILDKFRAVISTAALAKKQQLQPSVLQVCGRAGVSTQLPGETLKTGSVQ